MSVKGLRWKEGAYMAPREDGVQGRGKPDREMREVGVGSYKV